MGGRTWGDAPAGECRLPLPLPLQSRACPSRQGHLWGLLSLTLTPVDAPRPSLCLSHLSGVSVLSHGKGCFLALFT